MKQLNLSEINLIYDLLSYYQREMEIQEPVRSSATKVIIEKLENIINEERSCKKDDL